jgi:Mu-like prophage I protein
MPGQIQNSTRQISLRGAENELTKTEPDGEHPMSHYLVAGNSSEPETWHLRVRDANGRLDHRLMGAAWAALHGGFRGRRYEGPDKLQAIARLKNLYQREGMEAPGVRASETAALRAVATRESAPRFMAALPDAAEPGSGARVRIPLAVTGTWVRGLQQFSITRRDLEAIARNFRARQNGEINVDYDHASEMPEVASGGPIPSAGRIVAIDAPKEAAAEASGGGGKSRSFAPIQNAGAQDQDARRSSGSRFILYGWYEPTARASQMIRRREYRYISPAIDWSARSKQTGRAQGATLTSVALTNRPFLEELPQIHLSDPAYRLIDVNDVHVDTSLPDEEEGRNRNVKGELQRTARASAGAGIPDLRSKSSERGSQISNAENGNSSSETGGFMKKVQVSALPAPDDQPAASGKIMIAHPDLADEYFADPDEVQDVLEEMGLAGGAASSGADGANATGLREIPLSDAAALLSEAEARGKMVPAAEFFRARVEQAVDDAVKAGKILPRQRQDWRRIALADFPTFSKLMGEQASRVPLKPLGFSGSAPVDVPTQVKFLAEQRMRERGLSFGQALSEIGREQPGMIQQYRKAVSGE